MRDMDIRQALRSQLADRFADDPDTRVVEELGLCQGNVRIDIAVVNGTLHGYEIKSEKDTLRRLPSQSSVYSKVFDTVTVVVGPRHETSVRDHIPEWWGITVARHVGGETVLNEVKPASKNHEVVASALVQLLWRDEALSALERRGLANGVRGKPRRVLWGRLTENLDTEELSREVCSFLKSREGWRSDA
ncbi:MAG: sce7726 family protein [Spirochaetales bacterium]|nr:sce7726 family protein [Spirochaetales bacterium]